MIILSFYFLPVYSSVPVHDLSKCHPGVILKDALLAGFEVVFKVNPTGA